MIVEKTPLPGLLLVKPKVFGDERGYFFESFQQDRYRDQGIVGPFVQDNVSKSSQGILRGLHFQKPYAQAKLISALVGSIYDVAVDIRLDSPTFGKWFGTILSDENKHQLYVPRGFAHGFLVLSDTVICQYKVDEFYHPETEHSLIWNDPDLNIDWPKELTPLLSKKDGAGKRLKDFTSDELPRYH